MDKRLESLKAWVNTVLDVADYELRPASADASFRRYFRISCSGLSYIVMDAPPEKENLLPFIEIAQRLQRLGLNVPEVLEQDLQQGYLLLSDLGEQMYLPQLNSSSVDRLYGDALGALAILQAGIFTDSQFLPEYSASLLQREMELFREWYLGKHLGLRLSPAQNAILDQAFSRLTQNALAQPTVWVHRDYHSRNLMLAAHNNPGILDFQDAVRGPITYDLVSLLRDCYIAWPRPRVEQWVIGYHELARRSGLPVISDAGQFLRDFDLMGVQRHLKATGIFARLNHRDGKPGYLPDIPRTLGYVLEVSARQPLLQDLHALLLDLRIPDISR